MQRCGHEDLLGLFVAEFELGAVILEKIQVVSHGQGVLEVNGGQLEDIVFQDGVLECGGEDLDIVVNWRWRTLGGGHGVWGGWWSITVVQGYVQVADVVKWCVADHAFLLQAGRSSGAGSWRLLAGSLSIGIGIGICGGVHATFVSVELV